MVLKEEVKAAFELRRAVLKYVKDMNIKKYFSVIYSHKLEDIGLGGVKIIIGDREISPLKEE